MGGEWYTDAVTDFSNKDNYDIMLKSLIVNDDEMVASNRMSFAETKAFISKTSLRYRKPYMKRTEEFAKNFILARTTNQTEYLKDKTGERVFYQLWQKENDKKNIQWKSSQRQLNKSGAKPLQSIVLVLI
nr:virulence-associated E family protein [Streptococcus pneumoniae]